MVTLLSLSVLMVVSACVNQGGSKPPGIVPYTPDQVIIDLESGRQTDRDRALTFLFDLASSRKCGELGKRKKAIVRALVTLLDDVGIEDKRSILMIFNAIGPDASIAVPSILRFIPPETREPRLTEPAQHALRGIGEDAVAALPALIESFKLTSIPNMKYYRRALPSTLIAIAPKDPRVESALQKGLKDEDVGVRVSSAEGLWKLGVRAPELKQVWSTALRNADTDIREDVGSMVSTLVPNAPELVPLALAALNDPAATVRKRVIFAFLDGDLPRREFIDAFVERLTDSDEWVRAAACACLGRMKVKATKALPELNKSLRDKELRVRVYAANALCTIDPNTAQSVLAVLTEGLTHSSRHVRAYAATALKDLGPQARPAIPALRNALLDDSREVREQATQAIKRIESGPP